jgi:hypothetical protein
MADPAIPTEWTETIPGLLVGAPICEEPMTLNEKLLARLIVAVGRMTAEQERTNVLLERQVLMAEKAARLERVVL